jgi:small-conductance mechanosensitive channel
MAEEATTMGYLATRVDALREHAAALWAAAPGLPAELSRVYQNMALEALARGPGTIIGLIIAFMLIGFAVEGGYRKLVRPTADTRPGAIGLRFVRELGAIATFTFGSAAVFLAFAWPLQIRAAVLSVLAAFIIIRLVLVGGRTLLSPGDASMRIAPASDAEARFWLRRLMLFSGWLAIGWVIVGHLAANGMLPAARQLVAYLLGLGLLAIALESFWRHSRLIALSFVAIWALWVVQAWGLFWLAVVAVLLPGALRLAQGSVDHMLRPEGSEVAGTRGVLAAALSRTLRALLVVGALYLLIHAFGLNVEALAAGDTLGTRLLRGAAHALAILLVADVLWKVAASLIDLKLAAVRAPADAGDAANAVAEAKAARLRTLLPIVRGTLAAVLIVTTVLMALSALGVQITPLMASAGVVGVAIGFGSQTLVRDMLSKFFYLFDDAFRVGEYIQSGNYKGTVEHLGVRSVRLRHHRGSVYTIPYGQLGAVQNSSRDWVIDKMTIGLTYDTDLVKVKKIIKDISKELAQNPEFAADFLEPLKMQGVESFGDFAIQVRIKMMTRPNRQFSIRRRAYAMMKERFAANGVHFAYPTVQVAGNAPDPGVAAAVARQALDAGKSAA